MTLAFAPTGAPVGPMEKTYNNYYFISILLSKHQELEETKACILYWEMTMIALYMLVRTNLKT